MTVLDVAVPVYYQTATKLADAASDFWAAVDGEWNNLARAESMAGSYSDAREWAETYDDSVKKILNAVNKIMTATHSYAVILQQIGHNHETAEHSATVNAGLPPVAPTPPIIPVPRCWVPIPSAGGPGNGLIAEGVELAEMIGITVPDGDADALQAVAETWERIVDAAAVTKFPFVLADAAAAFAHITAPEVEYIDEDLREMQAAAEAIIAAASDMAASCRGHRTELLELREQIMTELKKIRDALLQELALTAAISVATSFITFGVGAAVGTAAAATICARYARTIRTIIERWKAARRLADSAKFDAAIERSIRRLERIEDLTPNGRLEPKQDPSFPPKKDPIELPKIEHPEGVPKPDLPRADIDTIGRYTADSAPINNAIRSGEQLTPAQIAERNAMNSALDRCPPYEGMVTRRVDLSPEDLERYEPGSKIIEKPFTSASATPDAAKDRAVEIQIWSTDGRYVGHHSTAPQELEVTFKTDTPFEVVNKFPGPNGRIIIQMRELPRP
ncbi:hypothetical protein [Nocardia sp. CNY236]|uniref:hypothetical protein n=1 Tax=Nocardia sp. CNY236 TaxID=1169152 RepID=UPI00040F574F|nr:hypothetical protein [Nocardia sp. CNY236]